MGTVLSVVGRINEINIKPFPTRATMFHRVVREGGGVYATKKGDNNTVWTTSRFSQDYAYMVGDWGGSTASYLNALLKLKLITRQQMEEHMLSVRSRNEHDQADHDMSDLEEISKRYGVPVPKRLYEKIQKQKRIAKDIVYNEEE